MVFLTILNQEFCKFTASERVVFDLTDYEDENGRTYREVYNVPNKKQVLMLLLVYHKEYYCRRPTNKEADPQAHSDQVSVPAGAQDLVYYFGWRCLGVFQLDLYQLQLKNKLEEFEPAENVEGDLQQVVGGVDHLIQLDLLILAPPVENGPHLFDGEAGEDDEGAEEHGLVVEGEVPPNLLTNLRVPYMPIK